MEPVYNPRAVLLGMIQILKPLVFAEVPLKHGRLCRQAKPSLHSAPSELGVILGSHVCVLVLLNGECVDVFVDVEKSDIFHVNQVGRLQIDRVCRILREQFDLFLNYLFRRRMLLGYFEKCAVFFFY